MKGFCVTEHFSIVKSQVSFFFLIYDMSRVASVGVRRVKSALARSKSSDKFVIGFKQPLFVN